MPVVMFTTNVFAVGNESGAKRAIPTGGGSRGRVGHGHGCVLEPDSLGVDVFVFVFVQVLILGFGGFRPGGCR